MPFDTALSGIRAASTDLTVTGNNIANASTTGFKSSRAEFGDVYATSVLGAGSNAIGSGVQVQDVAQAFTQGNVTFTENELDLAINGNGFFLLSNNGEQLYSRAGTFGLDDSGYITNNVGARLQGFDADSDGNIGGITGDIQIQTSNLAPRQTTLVESVLNLDSTEPVLLSVGREFVTEGVVIGESNIGLRNSTSTTIVGTGTPIPPAPSPTFIPAAFELSLAGASGGNGTINIDLGALPNNPQIVVSAINTEIFSADPTIDVVASLNTSGIIEFTALREGEGSMISIANPTVSDIGQYGLNTGLTSIAGIPAVSNGYPEQMIEFIEPDGQIISYTSLQGATAAQTASELNGLTGISATAQTDVVLTGHNSPGSNMTVNINGVDLVGDTLASLEDEINGLSNSLLPGVMATLDATGNNLSLSSVVGDDIAVSISSIDPGDALSVQGATTSQTLTVPVGGGISDDSAVVGGYITMVLDQGYEIGDVNPLFGMLQPISDAEFTDVIINEFDPADQTTYNSATSMSIYDSLGNSHVMTQYFVKQDYDTNDPTTSPNNWVMYAQIDGRDIGDPDTSLLPPENLQPTRTSFNVFFNEDGSLNPILTEDMLISNWVPMDANGQPNGAMGPQNVLAGGTVVIPEPPVSSNFVIDLEGTTQFGSNFSVNDVDQDGYATGRLSGLSIDESGIIFARYTNGESQVLAQVALADFTNQQGLQPVGNTMWAENFESGQPNVGTPRSAALGALQSGALEESNVDLSEQLVNLIIAQRNFQASAKTIETADQVTQTIINLR